MLIKLIKKYEKLNKKLAKVIINRFNLLGGKGYLRNNLLFIKPLTETVINN